MPSVPLAKISQMLIFRFPVLVFSFILLVSCSPQPEVKSEENLNATGEDKTYSREPRQLDTNLLINTIDNKRVEIENQLDQVDRIVIETDSLRAKISQKWDRIHYYLIDGKVVRIKTYPHEGISTRTEEFYFNEGDLILVTIEDEGLGKRGKEKGVIDKMFYFYDGLFLTEYSTSKEREFKVKESESQELFQEAGEYLEILANQK
jgi:hypothetical protein